MNRYVAVQYQKKDSPEEFISREYTYIDGLGLMLGDLVTAPTATGPRVAKVTRVGIPESEIESRVLPILKTIDTLHTEEGADQNV